MTDWYVLERKERIQLLPNDQIAVGDSWQVDPDVAETLLTRFYPTTELNVFAAIKAHVPARVEHVSSRMYFSPQEIPANVSLPEPPIAIDYSAQNDGWSKGHDTFVKAMNERKYPLLMYWGPFGDANNHAGILKVNDLINSFDWLSVRKNEAYLQLADHPGRHEPGTGEIHYNRVPKRSPRPGLPRLHRPGVHSHKRISSRQSRRRG